MARVMALDYGVKRTGIAVTDELQMIASGLTTIDTPSLLNFLEDYFKKEKVETVVVGEPKQKDNSASQSEVFIAEFLKKFTEKFPEMKLVRVDERFTSKMAFQTMIDSLEILWKALSDFFKIFRASFLEVQASALA